MKKKRWIVVLCIVFLAVCGGLGYGAYYWYHATKEPTIAFGSFPVNGDFIKSKEGRATYNGTTWRGTFQSIEPGQGYIFKSASTETRTFTFPTGSK